MSFFKNHLRPLLNVASWLGIFVAFFSFVVFFYSNYRIKYTESQLRETLVLKKLEAEKANSISNIAKLKLEIIQLSESTTSEIDTIKKQMQELVLLTSTQNLNSSSQKKIISLITEQMATKLSEKSDTSLLINRIKVIEDVVVQNPEKALQIPFIKKELERGSKSIEQLQDALKSIDASLDEIKLYKSQIESLINQVNMTNNWMIGMFGALVVSIVGLLINSTFRQRPVQP